MVLGGPRKDLFLSAWTRKMGVLARVLPYQSLSLCKFHYMMSLLVEYSHLMEAMSWISSASLDRVVRIG
jgi:hypothetical protein